MPKAQQSGFVACLVAITWVPELEVVVNKDFDLVGSVFQRAS